MKMSNGVTDVVSDLTSQLAKTSVDGQSSLSFARRSLKLDSADDAKEVLDALQKNPDVETLILNGNTLGVDAAKAIGKALEQHKNFKNALWSDLFTGRLKSEIPEALEYLGEGLMTAGAQLRELDLSDNALGPNGMKGLLKLLKSPTCFSLQVLRLHNNGLGTTGGEMLADCLTECHRLSVEAGSPLALRVFQSGRGRLENKGSIALAKAFKAMGSLEEVVMPQNGIYHEGISALAEAFKVNKNLRHLNLQDNTFTEKGALTMAKALEQLDNLEEIHFGDCLLKTKGAKILAKALARPHTKLKKVNLTYNEIGESGANAVAEAMEGKQGLELLELDGNCLGPAGIELVEGTMEGFNLQDRLGTFEEDDGDEDEEEDVDEENSTVIEVTADDDDVKDLPVTPKSTRPINAVDFLQFPSPTKLRELGPDKGQALVDHLADKMEDVEAIVLTVIRICSVVTREDNKVKEDACHCADALLKKMLTSCDDTKASRMANAFLVHLGLLKSEDKMFKPVNSAQGALIVLKHVIVQPYFPKLAKDLLGCFIAMPNAKLDSCMELKHSLLQVLHQ